MEKDALPKPKISIIIPVYNCEGYIGACIDSLKQQEMVDWEAVIVHHDSSDSSYKRILDAAAGDERFVIFNETGLPLSQARNFGIEQARGDYIGFVDADDTIEPDMYSILLSLIEEADADFASCGYFMDFPQFKKKIPLFQKCETIDVKRLKPETAYLRYIAGNPNVWNKLYRRSLIVDNKVGFYVNQGEDLLFHLMLFEYLKKIVVTPRMLYHYRQRKSSLMHDRFSNYSKNAADLLQYFLSSSYGKTQKELVYFSFCSIFTGMMFIPECTTRPLSFFKQQIAFMRECDFFEPFCEQVFITKRFKALYIEKAISIRFYFVIKTIFSLCYLKLDCAAAMAMWISSRLVGVKKHRFQPELFA